MHMTWILILAAAVLTALALPVAAEESRVFKNEKGQETGRSITRGNTTTFSNEKGQQTGRVDRRPDGTQLFYDASGRSLGSSRGRR
jgi:hypothetical protein